MIPLRDADADGNRDCRFGFTLLSLRLVPRPEAAPHREAARFDGFAQLFEMRQALFGALAGEHEREFLAAVAIGRAAPRRLRQAGRDEAQYVITGIVAVGVVEALEMIDIDHGDGELPAQS